MHPDTAYAELLHLSRERAVLNSCSSLLGWDEQTYMPRGAAEHRAAQHALLAGLVHARATEPRIGDLLSVVEESDRVADPESAAAVNVREWRRDFERATKLPRELVESLAHATSLGQQVWVEAKPAGDFARFQPSLKTIVDLKRREAACLGKDESDYDALLDDYEPGARSVELKTLFDRLLQALVPLIESIAARPQPDTSGLQGAYPIDRQRVFGEAIAATVGFDFARGRLDETAHPFCTDIGPGDCRITTRYDLHDFTDGFFSILHEVGHGLYEQGLPHEHYGTPMGLAVSLGVHESQSRLWENAIGRGRAFWTYAYPLAQRVFHAPLDELPMDAFLSAINRVEPSLIRVQADELTYNLHIIIRFELERAMLARDLPLADLPGVWSEKYQHYLGVKPANDREGCLQDVHWSAGLFGYFPTYTLGNVFGAQLYAAAQREVGDLDLSFRKGDFAPLLEWLRAKIHTQGQRHRSSELIERVTDEPPDARYLIENLRAKAAETYGL